MPASPIKALLTSRSTDSVRHPRLAYGTSTSSSASITPPSYGSAGDVNSPHRGYGSAAVVGMNSEVRKSFSVEEQPVTPRSPSSPHSTSTLELNDRVEKANIGSTEWRANQMLSIEQATGSPSAEAQTKAQGVKAAIESNLKTYLKLTPMDRMLMRRKMGSWKTSEARAQLLRDVDDIYQKKLDKLPTGIDLPRLVRNARVQVGGDNRSNGVDHENDTVYHLLVNFLKCLALEADNAKDEMEGLIAEHFPEEHDEEETSLAAMHLKSLLNAEAESERLQNSIQFLKCCNQSIIAPMFMLLKNGLGSGLAFRSLPRSWQIFVQVDQGRVIHRMVEVVSDEDDCGKTLCTFQWEARIDVDVKADVIVDVQFDVGRVGFDSEIDEDRRFELMKIFMMHGYAPEVQSGLMASRTRYVSKSQRKDSSASSAGTQRSTT
eukprot:Clim_evm130s147 gene=Clim_evmTU130s147